jgi:hypothetical protein
VMSGMSMNTAFQNDPPLFETSSFLN